MKWGSPEMVVWLWLVPVAAVLLSTLLRRRNRCLRQLADDRVRSELLRGWRPQVAGWRLACWLTSLALSLVALARPQWGFRWEEVRRRGLDILIALDTSRSMTAQDVKPDRLQQAKWGIRDFVKQLAGDRVGLMAFAGTSFLQCPLTSDYGAFMMMLDDVYAGILPRGGTSIESALRDGLDLFKQPGEADRVLILVTDGDDLEGDPTALIDELKKAGIRVYAIGIGSREGDLIPVPSESGGTVFFKDREGRVVKTALREDLLQKLALDTGGAYIRSAPGESGLDRLFREGLADLRRSDSESKQIRSYTDRFPWFLGAALALLALEALLPQRNRKEADPA